MPSSSEERAWYPSGPKIGPRVSSSRTSYNPPPPQTGPDPKDYKFVKVQEIGKHLVAMLQYKGVQHYEGRKILVFKNTPLLTLVNRPAIDPHFSDDKKYLHPFARFAPTDEGWAAAVKLCGML